MTILRSGSTDKYSSNWARAFGTTAKPQKGKPQKVAGRKTAVKVAVKAGAKKAKAKSQRK